MRGLTSCRAGVVVFAADHPWTLDTMSEEQVEQTADIIIRLEANGDELPYASMIIVAFAVVTENMSALRGLETYCL